MSTVINQDYSAYYKGTQNAKKYSSNRTGQKAAASQHGTVTGATSKYGDDAVAEFSKGGMAALEESRQASTKTESAEKSTSTTTAGEAGLSKKAQEFLKKLRNTYGNMDFFVADFNKGDKAKDILSGATKEFSVIFSSEELEKMASDEKYAAEYMQRIQGAVRMSERINQEFGFTSAFGENANGTKISKIAISFNQDGTTSFFAELEKSSEQQRERIEKAREEKRAEKKEQEKRAERDKQTERTTVQADSLEELLEKIRKVDWDKVV